MISQQKKSFPSYFINNDIFHKFDNKQLNILGIIKYHK